MKGEIYNYWRKNFENKNIVEVSEDIQQNIARTKNGKVINEEDWAKTIEFIKVNTKLTKSDTVLELCCGNGALLGNLAPFCKEIIGVDYSNVLLDQLKKEFTFDNINTIHSDILNYELSEFYNKVIFYFSIQHFSEKDLLLILDKYLPYLHKGGYFYIGDIPDESRKWEYINKKEYHIDYFNRVKEDRPKIGYWYHKNFFKALNSYYDNYTFEVIEQPSYQINSDHSFDLIIKKND